MCYQVVELYAACRCLYYQHAVDRCTSLRLPLYQPFIQELTGFVSVKRPVFDDGLLFPAFAATGTL
ncbi:hypothetical protein B0H66DRAFT_599401 [Apodospora peruviana]|uniref:Uncharacterized protein n=1 Tax=Apodospora peruviana TaxID=516989 RepID=A0AAE0IHH1_9PEZI|nr:hypothetical protein B0H66DRAFT_599401 [Apodospora peruviana]